MTLDGVGGGVSFTGAHSCGSFTSVGFCFPEQELTDRCISLCLSLTNDGFYSGRSISIMTHEWGVNVNVFLHLFC